MSESTAYRAGYAAGYHFERADNGPWDRREYARGYENGRVDKQRGFESRHEIEETEEMRSWAAL